MWLGEALLVYIECMGPAISRNSDFAISWHTVFCREHAQEHAKQHLKGSIASPKCARFMLEGSIALLKQSCCRLL